MPLNLQQKKELVEDLRSTAEGAVVSAALGALVFANAYFVDNGVLWQILNPARMLAALAWAAGASQANVATAGSGEPSGDG